MRIAIVAHDANKSQMVDLLRPFISSLKECELVGTGTTGARVQEELNLPVRQMKSGPLGGDQQIGALVSDDQIDAVIFLRDPLTAQPHEPDIAALMRVCDVHNVPLATNRASAEFILQQLLKGQ